MPLTLRSMLILILTLFTMNCPAAETGNLRQSPVNPTVAPTMKYPMVVLYSTSWCPHCREAKEYFTKNNIPFINRDVELDDTAMDNLTKKYKSQGVPVIVIGKDEKILKGFDQAVFEKAVGEVQRKQK